MWESRKCGRCGMVAPGAFGLCRSCGAISGRSRLAAVSLLGLAAVASAVVWFVLAVRSSEADAPATSFVLATCEGWTPSSDGKGTDATGTIRNVGSVAVDVVVIVRGEDASDKMVIEQTLGPFLNVPAGGTRAVRTTLAINPLKAVTFETVHVVPATNTAP